VRRQRTTFPAPIIMSMFWWNTALGVFGVALTTGLILWAIFRYPGQRVVTATTRQAREPQRKPAAASGEVVAEVMRSAAPARAALRQPVS